MSLPRASLLLRPVAALAPTAHESLTDRQSMAGARPCTLWRGRSQLESSVMSTALLAVVLFLVPQNSHTVEEVFGDVVVRKQVVDDPSSGAVRHGDYTSVRSDGSTVAAGEFEHGERIGRWRLFHANGELAAAGRYRGGERWANGGSNMRAVSSAPKATS